MVYRSVPCTRAQTPSAHLASRTTRSAQAKCKCLEIKGQDRLVGRATAQRIRHAESKKGSLRKRPLVSGPQGILQ
jgi:hypothetical protein